MKQPRPRTTFVEHAVSRIGSIPSLVFHSIVFAGFTILTVAGPFPRDLVLLVWNTLVSLEAIYLALFIQITVNRHTTSLREVEEDIDEIQEDIDEIQEDVDEIQEDVEEMSEEEKEQAKVKKEKLDEAALLQQLTSDVQRLLSDLEALKKPK